MKNKIVPIVIVFLTLLIVLTYLMVNFKAKVPDDYIAVFHGKTGEMTYIYKTNNNHANMGFKYINTISTKGNVEIKDSGEVTWTDDVFSIAKKHGAYDYVKIPNDDKIYSIEEFQKRFLMN